MNEKQKTVLGYASALTLFLFAASALWYTWAYSRSVGPSSYRAFSVSAEGKIVAVPDVAEFTWSVVTQNGKDLGSLQKDNTRRVNDIIAFIKSAGVDAKDIKTINYNVEPRYQNYSCGPWDSGFPCPPPVIVGYTVRQTVSVKVRDFAKISDILAGVIERGANAVSSLNFTVDDPYALQNKAREEAIAKARERAKEIAKAGGFRLGRLLSVDEYGYPIPYPLAMETAGRGGADGGELPPPVVEPGSQEITVNVILRYEIR